MNTKSDSCSDVDSGQPAPGADRLHKKVLIVDDLADSADTLRLILEMDGDEVARLLALAGYGDVDSRKRTTEAGFDHHAVKPADIDLLISLIAAD